MTPIILRKHSPPEHEAHRRASRTHILTCLAARFDTEATGVRKCGRLTALASARALWVEPRVSRHRVASGVKCQQPLNRSHIPPQPQHDRPFWSRRRGSCPAWLVMAPGRRSGVDIWTTERHGPGNDPCRASSMLCSTPTRTARARYAGVNSSDGDAMNVRHASSQATELTSVAEACRREPTVLEQGRCTIFLLNELLACPARAARGR